MSCAIRRPRLPVMASRKQAQNRSRRASPARSRTACQPASAQRSAVKARKVRAVSVSASSVPSSNQSSRTGTRHRIGERSQQSGHRRDWQQGANSRACGGDEQQGQQAQRQGRHEPERNGDHRYSSETMKRVQPSGLKGALASRPAAITSAAVTAGGSASIQPMRRFGAAPSGGSRNHARCRIGRK